MLVQECEHSGLQLLAYLHKFVAHTRATISRASNKAIRVNFEWTHIRNLIDKLKSLRASLEDTALVACHNSERSTHPSLLTPPAESNGSWLPRNQNYDGIQTPIASPEDWIHNQSPESLVYDCSSATTCSPNDGPCRNPQSLPASWQGTCQQMFEKPNLEDNIEVMQTLQLSHEWNKVFRHQHLPALVLSYAIEPSAVALNAPVALDCASYSESLQRLEQHLERVCSGLLKISIPMDRSHDVLHKTPTGLEIHQLVVVDADKTISEIFGPKETRDTIHEVTRTQGFDPLSHLASACLTVMRCADPTHYNVIQRYLMYLAHILRHATHFSLDKMQLYLDGASETVSHMQSQTRSKAAPWSTLPQPMDSLHLTPELHCYTDIRTFAAREALPLHPRMEPSDDEPRRRFAITAHALSSWASHLPDSHPHKMFEPSLQKRKEVLRHLLIHLTPPESTVCYGRYSLWKEAVRLCNTGFVREPVELLVVFLAASQRPDYLWKQAFGSLLGMNWRPSGLLDVLRGKVEGAVAPELVMMFIGELERREEHSGRCVGYNVRRVDDGGKNSTDSFEYLGW